MLAALCNSMGGEQDDDLAWDAFQDACCSVNRACDKAHLSSKSFEICVWAYVYRSAIRRLQRLKQKRSKQRAAEHDRKNGGEKDEATPLEVVMRRESCQRILQLIDEFVQPSLRGVVIKILEGELSLREAARLCDVPKDQIYREVAFVRSQFRANESGRPDGESNH